MIETPTSQPTVVRTDRGLSIAGTRLMVHHVLGYLKAGQSPEAIREDLSLTEQQIADVLAYIAEHREEVEAEYQEVLEQGEEIRRYWEERNRKRFEEIAARPLTPEEAVLEEKLTVHKRKLGLL
jgi:hypothetical protein